MEFYNSLNGELLNLITDTDFSTDPFIISIYIKSQELKLGSPRMIKREEYPLFLKSYYSIVNCEDTISMLKQYKTSGDIGIDSSIIRFICALRTYEKGLTRYPLLKDLLIDASKFNFISKLKKIRQKSFLKSIRATLEEESEEFKQLPYTQIQRDIGEIFNYQWLPWLEEDIDDFNENSFIPVNGNEKFFRKMCKRFFNKNPLTSKIDIEEIKKLIQVSITSKSTFFGPNWLEKSKMSKNTFSEYRGIAQRCIIPVAPGNSRDTVINRLEDLNTISLIEKVFFKYLELIDERTVLRDIDKFNRYYKNLQKNLYFWCRDYQKEGLTRPRYINSVILQEFNKAYDLNLPERFFDEFLVMDLDKKTIRKPLRGTGLGMANSMVTLMQLIIHEEIVDECIHEFKKDSDENIYIDILTLNDDNIAAFQNYEQMEMFIEIEDRILKDLDLIKKKSKSFWAYGAGVFCEQYFSLDYPNLNEKASFKERTRPDAFRLSSPLMRYERYNIPDIDPIQQILPKELGGCLVGEFSSDFLLKQENFSELEFLKILSFESLYSNYYLSKNWFNKSIKEVFNKEYRNPLYYVFPKFYENLSEREKTLFNFGKVREIANKFKRLSLSPEKEFKFFSLAYTKKLKLYHTILDKFKKESKIVYLKDIYTRLQKTGKYILNPDLNPIVLEESEIDWISLKDNGNIFYTENMYEDLIKFRLKTGGNPAGINFEKKIYIEKTKERILFPFPKDKSLFKRYLATYGSPKNARLQYIATKCLPLLEEINCNEINLEISKRNLSVECLKLLSLIGSVNDINLLENFCELEEEQQKFVLEEIDQTLNPDLSFLKESEIEEDIDIEALKTEINLLKNKIMKVEIEQIQQIEIVQEENSRTKFLNSVLEYYLQGKSGSDILDREILKSYTEKVEELSNYIDVFPENPGNIRLQTTNETSHLILKDYISNYLDFGKLTINLPDPLRFLALAEFYKLYLSKLVELKESETRTPLKSLNNLLNVINGYKIEECEEEILSIFESFSNVDIEEGSDEMIFPDDW